MDVYLNVSRRKETAKSSKGVFLEPVSINPGTVYLLNARNGMVLDIGFVKNEVEDSVGIFIVNFIGIFDVYLSIKGVVFLAVKAV